MILYSSPLQIKSNPSKHEREAQMGKGGVDNLVRARVFNLMQAHPYIPLQADDGEWNQPYLIADAVADAWGLRGLSEEDLGRLLLHGGGKVAFNRVGMAIASVAGYVQRDPSLMVRAMACDMMEAYAEADPEIMEMQHERVRRYAELNHPSPVS